MYKTDMELKVNNTTEEWTGSLEELMVTQGSDFPEHTARRIKGLVVGETITLNFDEPFTVERLS